MIVEHANLAHLKRGCLLLAAVLLAACGGSEQGEPGREGSPSGTYITEPVEWMLAEEPAPESTTLATTVALGGCAEEIASVEIDENATTVTIDVLAHVLIPAEGWGCLAIQRPTDIQVKLGESLGERDIVGDMLVDSI